MSKKIAVIVGSLRKDSLNLKLAHQLIQLAPDSLQLELISIGNLAIYNADLDDEGKTPEAWKNFRNKMKAFQGILFITPEYNRSIPGVLKNALDVGSRPYGQSIWSGKPAGIISASPGAIGGFGANHHLRQSLVFLDAPVMQQPEAYIGHAANLFNEEGELTNNDTRYFLIQFITTYANWVETNAKH